MKPLYLEFCGINSFSEKAQIDFKALLSGGVFGIFGDTGSGKSTILDSIHFALYGEIDRVPRAFSDCINYRLDSAYVIFDFELTTEGVRRAYRVRRERKRKNGTSKAFLYEYGENGELLALAEGTRDVDDCLEKIIGLTFEDFKMCIALPQGDFAALVKSTTSDRVKLVSRLFNLEKYGERLSKAVNQKYYAAEAEVNLVKAKLGENDGGSEENIQALKAQIAEDELRLESIKTLVAEKNAALAKAQETEKAKQDYEKLCAQLETLKTQYAEKQRAKTALERYPVAKGVRERADGVKTAVSEWTAAKKRLQNAVAEKERAAVSCKQAQDDLQAGDFEERIVKLSADLSKVQGAKADMDEEISAKAALDVCIESYQKLQKKCVEEDFVGAKAALEEQLSALGEDASLLDYFKRHYKDVLLSETYGEIREDLRGIAEKYPVTEREVAILLQKYTLTGDGETSLPDDIAKVQLAFKAQENKRKAIKTELEQLEKRKQAYDQNENEKKLLKQQGTLLRENYKRAAAKVADIKALGTEEEISIRLTKLKNLRKQAEMHLETAKERLGNCTAEERSANEVCKLLEQTVENAKRCFESTLKESGFESLEDAEELLSFVGAAEKTKAETEEFFKTYELVKSKIEQTDTDKFIDYDPQVTERLKEEKRLADEALSAQNKTMGANQQALENLLALREKYQGLLKELATKEERRELCDSLRSLLHGNKFLEFIASEYLQEICVTASKTLLSLTGGRYFLQYDKEFKVGDNLDGGNLRAVRTLSGGETFLVSLSLALSLSAALCLKSLRPIEFFFLDEGFGTLDEKLVDTVMDVLGKLSKNFAVGLISHVEELKHRIDNKVLVTGATESRGSTVRVETF